MRETLRPGNDAQHKSNQTLARIVMIGTFGLIELSVLQLLDQADPSEKLDQNRQATKGRDRPQRVANFDLSATKKRLKFLPTILFPPLRRIFNHNSFPQKPFAHTA